MTHKVMANVRLESTTQRSRNLLCDCINHYAILTVIAIIIIIFPPNSLTCGLISHSKFIFKTLANTKILYTFHNYANQDYKMEVSNYTKVLFVLYWTYEYSRRVHAALPFSFLLIILICKKEEKCILITRVVQDDVNCNIFRRTCSVHSCCSNFLLPPLRPITKFQIKTNCVPTFKV